MRSSSSLFAPSAIAILSMSLLCSLSGTAVSQTATGSAAPLPSITVEIPLTQSPFVPLLRAPADDRSLAPHW